MKLTNFGKAVRKARVETGVTLSDMSKSLGKSAAFFSAIEKGKTKIPLDVINGIIMFFDKKNFAFDENLRILANIDNGVVPIDELEYDHKLIVSTIANTSYTKEQLEIILDTINNIKRDI